MAEGGRVRDRAPPVLLVERASCCWIWRERGGFVIGCELGILIEGRRTGNGSDVVIGFEGSEERDPRPEEEMRRHCRKGI